MQYRVYIDVAFSVFQVEVNEKAEEVVKAEPEKIEWMEAVNDNSPKA